MPVGVLEVSICIVFTSMTVAYGISFGGRANWIVGGRFRETPCAGMIHKKGPAKAGQAKRGRVHREPPHNEVPSQ